eukprot:scaffold287638_cov22-Tisochrysis_lutea.AAC.1
MIFAPYAISYSPQGTAPQAGCGITCAPWHSCVKTCFHAACHLAVFEPCLSSHTDLRGGHHKQAAVHFSCVVESEHRRPAKGQLVSEQRWSCHPGQGWGPCQLGAPLLCGGGRAGMEQISNRSACVDTKVVLPPWPGKGLCQAGILLQLERGWVRRNKSCAIDKLVEWRYAANEAGLKGQGVGQGLH